MRTFSRLLLAALSAVAPIEVAARETSLALQPGWVIDRWTVDDGLPTNLISDIAATDDGNLWISSFDGLARMDGGDIRIFRKADWPVMSSNRFSDLHRGPSGSLWIVEENGQLLLWTGRGFRSWQAPEELPGKAIRLLEVDERLWLLTGGGLVELVDGEPIRRFPETGSQPIRDLVSAPGGQLFIATVDQVFAVDDKGASPVPGAASGVADLKVWADSVWAFADPAEVRRMKGGSFEPVAIDPRAVAEISAASDRNDERLGPPHHRAFTASAEGDFQLLGTDHSWVLGPEGFMLRKTRPEGGWLFVEQETKDAERPWTDWSWNSHGIYYRGSPVVAGRRIDGIVRDAEGNVWFTDQFRGLARLSPAKAMSISLPEGLPAQWAALAPDGSLWTGDDRGRLFRTEPGRGPGAIERVPLAGATRPIWTATLSASGGMLVGSTAWVGRIEEGEMRALGEPLEATTGLIRLIFESRDGHLWLSTDAGLFSSNLETKWRPRLDPRDRRVHKARAFVEQRDGALLVASNGQGLIRFGPKGTSAATKENSGLSSDRLRDILLFEDEIVWIATEDSGLCRAWWRVGSAMPEEIRCLSKAEGLHEDALHSLALDYDNRMWLSGNNGLFAVALEDLDAWSRDELQRVQSLVIDQRHGMLDREANGNFRPAMARDRKGGFWYPTMGGLVRIVPSDITPSMPSLRFDQIWIGDEARQLPEDEELRLSTTERDLAVSWTSPVGIWDEQTLYRYRLVGYDSRWRGPSTEKRASWTNLPAGDLVIEVEASLGGTWSKAPLRLALHRRASFRETAAYPLLLALLLIFATGLGFMIWSRAQRRRREELERNVEERTHALELKAAELEAANQRILTQNERLAEIDEMKNRFVANLSHELRTPLTLVQGSLADMAESQASTPDHHRLQRARRSAERLRLLVDQLLDIARLDAGNVSLRMRRLDLAGFSRVVADRFADEAKRRGIELVLPEDTASEPIYVDPDALDKVLGNLIGNSLKFTPDGGRVTLTLPPRGPDEGFALIEVSDTGIGITERDQRRLFERFYQADGQDQRRFEGVGIGLSLAAELVELHGGTLSVESCPGAGSTFRILLPRGVHHLAPDDVACTPDDSRHQPTPSFTPPETPAADSDILVLVVEDHPDMRAYLVEHFRQHWRVTTASDGAEALEAIAEQRPHAVVSDVMMPGSDGLELCRRIRADPSLADLPVMLVSAKGTEEDRIEGLKLADDYVTKPFFMPELLARVHSLVRHSSSGPEKAQVTASEVPSIDQAWLDRLDAAMAAGIENVDFNVESLAATLAVSPRQLQRETKRLMSQSPVELLREYRLARAIELIELRSHSTVAEIASTVGLSPSYFTRLYRARLGRTPSADLARG